MNTCESMVKTVAGLGQDAPLMYQMLRDFGKPFTVKDDPLTGRGIPKQCYRNAHNALLFGAGDRHLAYVEGLAMKPGLIPLQHAFLYDFSDGKVIDPTWPFNEDTEYFGTVHHAIFVMKHSEKTNHYGIYEGLHLLKMPAHNVLAYLKKGLHSQFYKELE